MPASVAHGRTLRRRGDRGPARVGVGKDLSSHGFLKPPRVSAAVPSRSVGIHNAETSAHAPDQRRGTPLGIVRAAAPEVSDEQRDHRHEVQLADEHLEHREEHGPIATAGVRSPKPVVVSDGEAEVRARGSAPLSPPCGEVRPCGGPSASAPMTPRTSARRAGRPRARRAPPARRPRARATSRTSPPEITPIVARAEQRRRAEDRPPARATATSAVSDPGGHDIAASADRDRVARPRGASEVTTPDAERRAAPTNADRRACRSPSGRDEAEHRESRRSTTRTRP